MSDYTGLEIAVIGMAARFPGAPNVDAFWNNLKAGRESITFFERDELLRAGLPAERIDHPDYVPAKGYVEGSEKFDASFFDVSSSRAEIMDPQHRMFLETSWTALEHAGYGDPTSYDGAIGVYGGCNVNTYLYRALSLNPDRMMMLGDTALALANASDHLATNVAYKMGLHGPAMTVKTACSTSLVAVHLATQSLLTGESDVALAGGATVGVPRKAGHVYQEGGINSPDGHCRPFDADAAGTVGGEGTGVVVLKRLDDARRDGDVIHAILRGSALNNDGRDKVGYTAPSVNRQAQVIATAQAASGVDPATISYVEAHGTATPLGDPIEVEALTRAFTRTDVPREADCALGSVKSNIGHLDAAAGIAGFIKTVLALRHRALPPSLNYSDPNPKLRLSERPFRVVREHESWDGADGPRRAGVSSFGLGGTNAHVILEEAPRSVQVAGGDGQVAGGDGRVGASGSSAWQWLPVSARTASALQALRAQTAAALREASPHKPLPNAAHTLQSGRTAMNHRCVVIASTPEDAADALDTHRDAREDRQAPFIVVTGEADANREAIGFAFPGQGAQQPGMGAGLYASSPTFRNALDRAADVLAGPLKGDVRALLFPDADRFALPEAISASDGDNVPADRLRQTRWQQPAVAALEWALAEQWAAWGVRPSVVVGHSLGEYVAATVTGALPPETMLRMVATRGKTMQEATPGAMLSVDRAPEAVSGLLKTYDALEVAAINASGLSVIAGPTESVDAASKDLQADGATTKRLRTSHAFHTASMQPAADQLREAFADELASLPNAAADASGEGTGTMVSSMTGEAVSASELHQPEYWAAQIRQPVRYAQAMTEAERRLQARQHDASLRPIFVEVGPGATLAKLAAWDAAAPADVVSTLPSIEDDAAAQGRSASAEPAQMLSAAAELWARGVNVDTVRWTDDAPRRVPMPTYPFERSRYWIEAPAPSAAPDTKPDTKPDMKSDTKPDMEPDAPLDAEPDVEPDAEPDVEPSPESNAAAPPAQDPDASAHDTPDADDDTSMHRVFERQLEVMDQQLDLLS